MDRNRILDKVIEVAIGLMLAGVVSVLHGLRTDINALTTGAVKLEAQGANHDRTLQAWDTQSRALQDRVRILELECLTSHRSGGRQR